MSTLYIKMARLFLIVLGLCLTISVQAQNATFKWSDLLSNTKVGLQNPTLVFPTNNGFTTYSIEKLGSQYYAPQVVYITKFNTDGSIEDQVDFSLPKRSGKDATLLKVINGETKLYVFSFIAVKKDKKNVLYAQVYDNATNKVLETQEIYTLPIEKVNNSGFFNICMSSNKSVFSVLVNKPFAKKTKEEIEVLILDQNLQTTSKNSFTLTFDSQRAYNEEIFVENNAIVSIVKKTDIFKKEPITSVINIKKDKKVEQIISGNKFYISDNKVVTINNELFLLGFATDNAKPAVSMGGAKDKSFFVYNLSENKLVKNQTWDNNILKKVLGKGFINLKVKDIIVKNEDIYIIGDCYANTSKPIEGKNFEYNYTHNFGPGVVIKFTPNGEVDFNSYIKYGEQYKNDMQRIGSFKPIVRNDIIYILGNENLSVLEEKKIVFGYKNINAKAIISRKIEADGSFGLEVYKSGMVGGKGSVVDFAATKTIQLNNNTFYVYAFGEKYQTFGKMTIE